MQRIPALALTAVVVLLVGASVAGAALVRGTSGVDTLNATANGDFIHALAGDDTVNGFGGRVFEPAPGRWAWIGLEIGI